MSVASIQSSVPDSSALESPAIPVSAVGDARRQPRQRATVGIAAYLQAAPLMCSLAYQPVAMRFRGLSVLTNTPPPTSQRSPGGMQQNAIMEPVLAKAARRLGIDSVALHRVNAPAGKALFESNRNLMVGTLDLCVGVGNWECLGRLDLGSW